MAETKSTKGETYQGNEKQKDVRMSNITSAKGLSDAVRTSLGPRGMDKMVIDPKENVVITNDGATILEQLQVLHPTAKMLVDLSKAQDVEAGDGTTSVVVIAGALLSACQTLLDKGIHPTHISEAFQVAVDKAEEVLTGMAIPVDINDRESLIKAATTSLSSKVVSQNASVLAPLAVDAVLGVLESPEATNVDLNDIKIVKKLGGTLDDTELIDGLVLSSQASHKAGGPARVKNAKIGLIQFCLSPPKTDMESNVHIADYTQMDRALREERSYLLNLCKRIKKTGCNVLLIQKSILRDAVTEMSLHFLAKMGIMVIRDVERSDIEFISKGLGCLPVSNIENFKENKLGYAELAEEQNLSGSKVVKFTGIRNKGKVMTVLARASNKLVLDETDRSIHDALCVVRSLIKKRFLIPGGSAPEVELSRELAHYSKTLEGVDSYCVRAYADALEVIPTTLAENCGLNPITIVTELRNRHARGEKYAGIDVKKGDISDMKETNVVQPLLVNLSAVRLATETVRMILKIDDIVQTR